MVGRDAATGTFRLGPDLIALGTQALRSMDLYVAAHTELEALAAETGETTTLEILSGDEVVILDEVHGHYLMGSSPEVGMRWPAHATSTGKVLLAAAQHQDGGRPGHGRRKLVALTPKTIHTEGALDRELATVWRQGYATAIEEIEPGFVAIGAPVRNHAGRVIAAISIGGPRVRFTSAQIRKLAPIVRRAADQISRRLGATADSLER
jgi:DNA-binding IclR family transcriptional regulator